MAGIKVKVDYRELKRWQEHIQKQLDDKVIEKYIEECLKDLAKKLIRKIKQRTPVNTGLLRNSWTIGSITKNGNVYEIEVYTDIEYASYVENGFRAHWVPGYWEGNQFVYDPNAKTGMQVGKPGGWVPGKFMLKISEIELERALPKFLQRKQEELLKKLMGGR